jgi:hypothetical protein
MSATPAGQAFVSKVNAMTGNRKHTKMRNFIINCKMEFHSLRTAYALMQEYGFEISWPNAKHPSSDEAHAKTSKPYKGSSEPKPVHSKQRSVSAAPNGCRGCGRQHSGNCVFRGHPDWNDTIT